ncbi:Ig-like domain-containing protein [Buttiauxella selenatireducens]|uniref:Ig-like domain-containing protein n=1 Tax=Buttiauxella selenatireducens TaxID=3073902 RepID=A0ABY9SD58_9ENTR|nr:Ig-like domain-containing protein [Buttiauxella sp. R73]WMY75339.1 Ig-like domain-containing protein [Buttiauxella sp. R73]
MATQNNLPGSVRITGFDNGELISQFSGGSDRVVNLTKPSIVRVQASPESVNYYERQGDDLIVHMKDGSTVRYQHFFTLDANGHHSELYFDDQTGSHHALFPFANEAGPATAQTVVPTYADSAVVAAASEEGSNNALLWIGAGLLAAGGIALAAGGGGGGGGGGGSDNNNGGGGQGGNVGNANGDSNNGGNNNGSNSGGNDPAAQPQVSTLTINPFAGDNVVSAVETLESQIVSGNTQAFNAGRTISITIEGQTWTGTVNSDGSWNISIPAGTLQQLAAGTHTLTVTLVDVNGVTLTQTQDFTVDLTVPAPTIDTPFGDGFLNLAEQGQDQIITGKTGITGPGQGVVLEFNGQSYTATVDENGNWQVTIPASALQAVPDGVAQMTVSVVDANGNVAEQSIDVTVDTVAPALAITDIGNNGVIDGLMINSGQDQIVRGTSDAKEAGDKVTVTFNGKTYDTTVDQNGNWQVNIPAADLAGKEGNNTVSAVITDPAGNTAAASKDFSLTTAVITLNNFAGDNVLDGAEMQINQILSGTTENIPVGTTVVINFAGTTYNVLVETGGVWHLDLTPAQLALADGSYTISVTVPGYVNTAVSESFTVNTTQPAIAIEIISTDDVLNASEIQQPITISGVTTLLGAAITVTFNNKTYVLVADGAGRWSAQIPAEDLAGLKDGPFDVQAQATLGGQTANVSHTFVVDTTAPVVTIDAVTPDNIVNATEAGAALTITGKVTPLDVNFAHQVTVTINGKTFTGNVNSDGTWSVQADANVLNGVQDGDVTIKASVNDAAGNTGNADHLLTLDTTPPALTIDTGFLQDGKLNFNESQADQILSGQTEAGAKVSLVINGKTLQTLADDSGHWSLTLSSGDLKTLKQGANSLELTATDVAGNNTDGSVSIDVKTTGLPTLTLDTLFGDGAVNSFEALDGGKITGTALNLPTGTEVTVVIGSPPKQVTVSGTVDGTGHWSATVPPNDMKILSDGQCNVTVTASDSYGNVGTASGSMEILIHQLPHAVLTPPLFVDGYLNLAEAQAGQALTGNSGIIGGGQFVTVEINGKPFKGDVDSNGNWTVHLPPNVLLALADGTSTIQVILTDRASNIDVSPDYSFEVRTHVLPNPGLDKPFGDGVLNAIEASTDETIGGKTGFATNAGQTVMVSVDNGAARAASVKADGSWELTLTSAELKAYPDGNVPVKVTVTDIAGNVGVANGSFTAQTHNVPVLTINTPFVDGVLNYDEAHAVGGQVITGSTGISGAGQIVKVTIGGLTVDAVVQANGDWSATIPGSKLTDLVNGENYPISVTVTDSVGNTDTESASAVVHVKKPEPTIDLLFGDEILNISEAAGPLTLSGTTGLTGGGQAVKVTIDLNGVIYNADVTTGGVWTLNLPAGALQGLTGTSHGISVTATDAYGNSATVNDGFTTAFTAPTVTLTTPLFTDNIVGTAEAGVAQILSGTLTTATTGTPVVHVIIGGKDFTATVTGNTWTLDLTGSSDWVGVAQGVQNVVVTISDTAHNTGSTSAPLTILTLAPTLTVDAFAGNNDLSYEESQHGVTLTGSSTHLLAGQQINVELAGKTFTTTIQANGSWSVMLTPEQLATLDEGGQTLKVTATDSAGNNASTPGVPVTIDHTAPPESVSINTIGGDGYLNIDELAGTVTISGKATGSTTTVTVTLNGTEVGTATVAGGIWSLTLSPANKDLLAEGVNAITATGQGAQDSITVTVDSSRPTITVDPFADNDIVDVNESKSSQLLSGTASVEDIGRDITIQLNGKNYFATVLAGGNWSVSIPQADVANLPQDQQNITLTLTDAAGNTKTVTHEITVATVAPLLEVDALGVGNLLTAVEIIGGLPLGGRGDPGDTVHITLGPISLTALVDETGHWKVQLPEVDLGKLTDGAQVIGLSVSDQNGNVTTANVVLNVAINKDLGVLIPDLFATDGILNVAESLVTQVITGKATGDYRDATVTVTLLGFTVTVPVSADGSWSVSVPPSTWIGLTQDTAGLDVSIKDINGNTTNTLVNIDLALTDLPVVGNVIASVDNIINKADTAVAQTVTGVVQGVEAGTEVLLKIGGSVISTTVDATGHWIASLPPALLAALPDGTAALKVSVTDKFGNLVESNVNLTVLSHNLPTITLNPLFGDGVLSIVELVNGVISGTATGLNGRTISLSINGAQQLTATVDANGKWSAALTPDVIGILQGLGTGNVSVSASATDLVGNPAASATVGLKLDLIAPVLNSVTLFGDGLLSAVDATLAQTITGSVGHAPSGSVVTVALGGKTFDGTVASDGSFKINLSPSDLLGLSDGNLIPRVTITTIDGNTSSVNLPAVTVAVANLPKVIIDSVFGGDGYLNVSEAGSGQTLTGKITAGITDGAKVVVTIGGTNYDTTVAANGTWSLPVPNTVLKGLQNGALHIGVTVTDKVGNTNTDGANTIVKLTTPGLSFNALATLNILTLLTKGLTLSGGSTNLGSGAVVHIGLLNNTVSTTAITDSNGNWTATIGLGLNLLELLSLSSAVNLYASDLAGNTGYLNVGLGGDIISTTPPAAPMMMMASMSETNTTGDETSTTHSTSTTSNNTTETTEHSADTSGDAAAYTIGGLSIDLADGTTVSGDTLHGSTGNDTVHLSTLGFVQIDGGAGIDTLVLDGVNMTLDLVAEGSKIQHIEIFDLGLSGTNSITLNLNEALNITDKPEDDLLIKGAKGDQVNLVNGTGDVWEVAGQREINGVEYDVYHNSSQLSSNTLGDVLIQQGLHVNLV